MSELQDIKKRIFSENKIEDVLELLGCWSVDTEQKGNLYVAGLPDGDNKRSVQVKNNENLSSSIRSKGIDGDIFDVVSYIIYESDTKESRKSNLHKSKFWICQKLNYPEFIDDFYKETSLSVQSVENPNKWLTKLKKSREASNNVTANNTYSLDILDQYGLIPYKSWIDEGLSFRTQMYFGVGIDVKSERITFPIHNKNGDLIGVKGRYCGRNKEIENSYKYLYLQPCNKSIEFFNYHRALPYIKEKREVIIVEGGKTTMFLHQWNYKNCISIEGDSLSEQQIDILKELNLDTKFIFAFDKDKDVNFIHKETIKLCGRMKYSLYDVDNHLENKDSPTDKGKEVWEKLYNNYMYKLR